MFLQQKTVDSSNDLPLDRQRVNSELESAKQAHSILARANSVAESAININDLPEHQKQAILRHRRLTGVGLSSLGFGLSLAEYGYSPEAAISFFAEEASDQLVSRGFSVVFGGAGSSVHLSLELLDAYVKWSDPYINQLEEINAQRKGMSFALTPQGDALVMAIAAQRLSKMLVEVYKKSRDIPRGALHRYLGNQITTIEDKWSADPLYSPGMILANAVRTLWNTVGLAHDLKRQAEFSDFTLEAIYERTAIILQKASGMKIEETPDAITQKLDKAIEKELDSNGALARAEAVKEGGEQQSKALAEKIKYYLGGAVNREEAREQRVIFDKAMQNMATALGVLDFFGEKLKVPALRTVASVGMKSLDIHKAMFAIKTIQAKDFVEFIFKASDPAKMAISAGLAVLELLGIKGSGRSAEEQRLDFISKQLDYIIEYLAVLEKNQHLLLKGQAEIIFEMKSGFEEIRSLVEIDYQKLSFQASTYQDELLYRLQSIRRLIIERTDALAMDNLLEGIESAIFFPERYPGATLETHRTEMLSVIKTLESWAMRRVCAPQFTGEEESRLSENPMSYKVINQRFMHFDPKMHFDPYELASHLGYLRLHYAREINPDYIISGKICHTVYWGDVIAHLVPLLSEIYIKGHLYDPNERILSELNVPGEVASNLLEQFYKNRERIFSHLFQRVRRAASEFGRNLESWHIEKRRRLLSEIEKKQFSASNQLFKRLEQAWLQQVEAAARGIRDWHCNGHNQIPLFGDEARQECTDNANKYLEELKTGFTESMQGSPKDEPAVRIIPRFSAVNYTNYPDDERRNRQYEHPRALLMPLIPDALKIPPVFIVADYLGLGVIGVEIFPGRSWEGCKGEISGCRDFTIAVTFNEQELARFQLRATALPDKNLKALYDRHRNHRDSNVLKSHAVIMLRYLPPHVWVLGSDREVKSPFVSLTSEYIGTSFAISNTSALVEKVSAAVAARIKQLTLDIVSPEDPAERDYQFHKEGGLPYRDSVARVGASVIIMSPYASYIGISPNNTQRLVTFNAEEHISTLQVLHSEQQLNAQLGLNMTDGLLLADKLAASFLPIQRLINASLTNASELQSALNYSIVQTRHTLRVLENVRRIGRIAHRGSYQKGRASTQGNIDSSCVSEKVGMVFIGLFTGIVSTLMTLWGVRKCEQGNHRWASSILTFSSMQMTSLDTQPLLSAQAAFLPGSNSGDTQSAGYDFSLLYYLNKLSDGLSVTINLVIKQATDYIGPLLPEKQPVFPLQECGDITHSNEPACRYVDVESKTNIIGSYCFDSQGNYFERPQGYFFNKNNEVAKPLSECAKRAPEEHIDLNPNTELDFLRGVANAATSGFLHGGVTATVEQSSLLLGVTQAQARYVVGLVNLGFLLLALTRGNMFTVLVPVVGSKLIGLALHQYGASRKTQFALESTTGLLLSLVREANVVGGRMCIALWATSYLASQFARLLVKSVFQKMMATTNKHAVNSMTPCELGSSASMLLRANVRG